MSTLHPCPRRDFVALSIAAPVVGWIPWFRPKEIVAAGVRFRILRNRRSSRRYVLLHGDDAAARQLLISHMETQRGTALLIDSAGRDVAIEGGKLDPSRMFSRAGAEASLRSLNPGWSAEQVNAALDLLDRQREKLLDALFPPDHGLLIALGTGAASVTGEAALADRHALPQPGNPNAFYWCTDSGDYQALAASPFNVVLGQHIRARDDGSLGRRAAARGVRYLLIEAPAADSGGRGEMLAWAEAHLP